MCVCMSERLDEDKEKAGVCVCVCILEERRIIPSNLSSTTTISQLTTQGQLDSSVHTHTHHKSSLL